MDYNHVGWLLVALATIDTGGGGYGGRDIDAGRDYTGRDRISIYADQDVWRSNVVRDLIELRERNDHLRTQNGIMMALIAALFLFGFAATAFAVRQFDQQDRRLDDIERSIGYRYVPPYPLP